MLNRETDDEIDLPPRASTTRDRPENGTTGFARRAGAQRRQGAEDLCDPVAPPSTGQDLCDPVALPSARHLGLRRSRRR